MSKSTLQLFVISSISPLLLWLAWPPMPFSPLLFVALVPLLLLEKLTAAKHIQNRVYFTLVYICLVSWNLSTTYWIFNTSISAGILVHVANALLLCFPFAMLRLTRGFFSERLRQLAFVSTWLTIEALQQNWAFSFPFLTLGNGISYYPQMIQFYEFTGAAGGSLWILISNILAFDVMQVCLQIGSGVDVSSIRARLIWLFAFVALPLAFSCMLYFTHEESGRSVNFVVVHPNIDCRTEKYNTDGNTLVTRYIDYTEAQIDDSTQYILWPETAITNTRWVNGIGQDQVIDRIRRDFLNKYPRARLISGAILYEVASTQAESEPSSPNARFDSANHMWYYTYNAAIQVSGTGSTVPFRTKEKLVPIEETIPYSSSLSMLRTIVRSLGGYSFDHRSENTEIFESGDGIKIAPLICYESLFANFTSDLVGKGANLLTILLNEGWYKNITGASQFMYNASIRAVENRRSIARSSNDGISCFVNQRGDLSNVTTSFSGTAIKSTLYANRKRTFYSIFGDIIGKLGVVLTALLVPTLLIRWTRKPK